MSEATITGAVVRAIVAHARASAPDECCGILIGSDGRVDDAVAARNIAARPSAEYLVDPRDHFDALRGARGRGLDVVGFYHSHPRSAATPSATDVAQAGYPGYLFAIVGLAAEPADVRLYRFSSGSFEPVSFATVD